MTASLPTPCYDRWGITVYPGDCLNIMRALPDQSVHSVVTDPPAGISFMGRDWDSDRGGADQWIAWLAERMREALRVLTPGGHALVWALPRTSHWTARALEDAGFEIRDCITHLFGSGFPKSLDVSRAIDRMVGAECEVVGSKVGLPGYSLTPSKRDLHLPRLSNSAAECAITAPATYAARQWAGWGTALKPASEHWWLVRKPFRDTVAGNVLEHGTGALNIDACRIAGSVPVPVLQGVNSSCSSFTVARNAQLSIPNAHGRWPPNVVLSHQVILDSATGEAIGDACADGCVDGCPLDTQSAGTRAARAAAPGSPGNGKDIYGFREYLPAVDYGDSGGASRFFPVFRWEAKAPPAERPQVNGVAHPTVKPLALMRWLVRLVTPPAGTVLDCFAGTGTTGQAARAEGFPAILIECDVGAIPLIRARLDAVPRSDAPPAGDPPVDSAGPVDLFS